MGVGRTDLFERERIRFDLLEIFYGSAALPANDAAHQALMHGKDRKEATCTVDDFP